MSLELKTKTPPKWLDEPLEAESGESSDDQQTVSAIPSQNLSSSMTELDKKFVFWVTMPQ